MSAQTYKTLILHNLSARYSTKPSIKRLLFTQLIFFVLTSSTLLVNPCIGTERYSQRHRDANLLIYRMLESKHFSCFTLRAIC